MAKRKEHMVRGYLKKVPGKRKQTRVAPHRQKNPKKRK